MSRATPRAVIPPARRLLVRFRTEFVMWGCLGIIARCGVRIAASPRLRFSPLEIFPQRQFQPVLPRVLRRLALTVALTLIVLHRRPVRMNPLRAQAPENRPAPAKPRWDFPPTPAMTARADRPRHGTAQMIELRPYAPDAVAGPGKENRTKSARNRPVKRCYDDSALISAVLRTCQAPPALAHAGGLWQGSARSVGVLLDRFCIRGMLP